MLMAEYVVKRDEVVLELPPEFREMVIKWAWDEGHSCGCEEVLLLLRGYVEDLKGPLEAFRARVLTRATKKKTR